MLGKLMPREGKFFDYFNDHAEQILQGAIELNAFMNDIDNIETHVRNVETIEKRADKITQQTVALLHKTFITPLDRDEIHQLISKMDDILDMIEDVAQSMFLYNVHHVTPEAKKLAEICVTCAEKVKAGVALLSNMENSDAILKNCAEIDKLEAEADHVMRSAMAKLFRDMDIEPRELIKLKAIYEMLEAVTDRCEDVANIIEGIVVENA
ncbi:MAG: DUF47 domain-containing protein [Burkholderiales bacterium]